jgi:hypothetical protein
MKRFAILLIVLLGLAPLGFGSPRGHSGSSGTHSSHRAQHVSHKSHVSGHGDSHYARGQGSSQQGGHYSNKHTANHS